MWFGQSDSVEEHSRGLRLRTASFYLPTSRLRQQSPPQRRDGSLKELFNALCSLSWESKKIKLPFAKLTALGSRFN